jgi:ribonucleotide reductase alpha subunit
MTTFTLSQNALQVLETCYLRREALRRIIETPEHLFTRPAKAITHAERLLRHARQAA